MKNPFIAAVLALASQAAAAVPNLDLIGAAPSKKRKGKARGFIKSIMSNRQERQLYRSKYLPHQGLREKSRRKDVTTWRACRGTGLNNQQFT